MYGGVIDILLALFPWLILRKTQLESREKIGLAVAMSLGALTGVIVILRTFYGLVQGDYNFGKPLSSPLPSFLFLLFLPLFFPFFLFLFFFLFSLATASSSLQSHLLLPTYIPTYIPT